MGVYYCKVTKIIDMLVKYIFSNLVNKADSTN